MLHILSMNYLPKFPWCLLALCVAGFQSLTLNAKCYLRHNISTVCLWICLHSQVTLNELHIFPQAVSNEAAHEGILLMQEIMKMTASQKGTTTISCDVCVTGIVSGTPRPNIVFTIRLVNFRLLGANGRVCLLIIACYCESNENYTFCFITYVHVPMYTFRL